MKEIRLINMVEKVLSTYNGKNLVLNGIKYNEILKYANFLNQPLNLGMFVPAIEVNGKWEVLEEPKMYKDYLIGKALELWHPYTINECRQFQQAKDNVLFEGFEIMLDTHLIHDNIEFSIRFLGGEDFETIQDLIKYNIKLTEQGLIKSGLK